MPLPAVAKFSVKMLCQPEVSSASSTTTSKDWRMMSTDGAITTQYNSMKSPRISDGQNIPTPTNSQVTTTATTSTPMVSILFSRQSTWSEPPVHQAVVISKNASIKDASTTSPSNLISKGIALNAPTSGIQNQ